MFHSGLVTMSAMLDEVYDRRPSARRSLRSGNLYTRMRRRAEEFGDRIGRAEGRTSISCATAGARQAPGTSCTIGAGNGCAVLMASSFSGIRNWLGCTRTTRQSSGAVVGNKLTLSMSRKSIPAIAYLRTSSTTNAGPDKDSDKRQRAAIAAFAKAHGYAIVDEFYDAAVSGSDPIGERPGFKAMLDRIAGNGVHCIVVESPDRFARDLTVQLTGHDFLKSLGVSLIPATAPDFFTEDTWARSPNSRRPHWSPSLRRLEIARKRSQASAVDARHMPRPSPRSWRWRRNCMVKVYRCARYRPSWRHAVTLPPAAGHTSRARCR